MDAKKEPEVVIFDLDNCLADDSARLPLIDSSIEDLDQRYAAYHDACLADPVNPSALNWLKWLLGQGRVIVFVTARPQTIRDKTIQWLKNACGVERDQYELVMRQPGDCRDSVAIKRDAIAWIRSMISKRIVAAYDDRYDICAMYEEELGAFGWWKGATVLAVHPVTALNAPEWDEPLKPGEAAELGKNLGDALKAAGIAKLERVQALEDETRVLTLSDQEQETVGAFGFRPGEAAVLGTQLGVATKTLEAEKDHRGSAPYFRALAAEMKKASDPDRKPDPITAADVLADMADTFRERNAVYGSNYKMVAPLVAVLFPKGVPPELVVTHQWHLFELILVKLSRFAISNLTHQDSIHDAAVYGAMIEAILLEKNQ